MPTLIPIHRLLGDVVTFVYERLSSGVLCAFVHCATHCCPRYILLYFPRSEFGCILATAGRFVGSAEEALPWGWASHVRRHKGVLSGHDGNHLIKGLVFLDIESLDLLSMSIPLTR